MPADRLAESVNTVGFLTGDDEGIIRPALAGKKASEKRQDEQYGSI